LEPILVDNPFISLLHKHVLPFINVIFIAPILLNIGMDVFLISGLFSFRTLPCNVAFLAAGVAIKLMWSCLCQCLNYFDLLSLTGNHQVVAAAATILDKITHKKIY
jgi:hypothetical protein